MPRITLENLLAEAAEEISHIDVQECLQLLNSPEVTFVDVREASEVQSGVIPGSIHVSRGLLEFQTCPGSPMHNPVFSSGNQFIFICASGGRAMLATKVAGDFGMDAMCMTGGMSAWQEAAGPIEFL